MRKRLQTGKRRPHGLYGTPTYISYREMLKRCYDPSVIRYPEYGGRGIQVCARWRENIVNFVEDMGLKPSNGHSLDRIDVEGDYCPENCRWATATEQANNKRNTRFITKDGITRSVGDWSRETGVPTRIIHQRMNRDGLTAEQALSPMREPGSGRHRKKIYG